MITPTQNVAKPYGYLCRAALLICTFALVTPIQAERKRPPLQVVASFSILADMVRAIGGDSVAVTSLVLPNSDAHVFEPSPLDAQRVAQAQLIFVHGLHFEGWIDRLIQAAEYRGPVIVATRGIPPLMIGGEPDPHAWQSLANAKHYIDNIRDALRAACPTRSQEIHHQAADYMRPIDMLEQAVQSRFAAIPQARRRVITSHDAFRYYAAAYPLECFAPQGWSTESEPSAADVARIVRQVKAQRVVALFVDNIADPRLIERIGCEADVKLGGTLYSDALSEPGNAADTYLKMIEHNTAMLVETMQSAQGPLADQLK